MSIILEQLSQILTKFKISSSGEEEILIAAKDVITSRDKNKEELTFEESCISDEEHMFKLEIEEDDKGILGVHHANESYIKQCFQVSTRLDRFFFTFILLIHIFNI